MFASSSKSILKNRKVLLGAIIALGFIITNVLLIKGIVNNVQRASVAEGQQRAAEVRVGERLPTLSGSDIYGNRLSLRYNQDGRKTILFVFSPRCIFCLKIMPEWQELIQGLNKDAFRMVGVTTLIEGTREYAAEHGLSAMPILAVPDPDVEDAYHFARTPQTILISPDGKIEKVWLGPIEKERIGEIEQALGVKFSTQAIK
jgi:peroxiredoxin